MYKVYNYVVNLYYTIVLAHCNNNNNKVQIYMIGIWNDILGFKKHNIILLIVTIQVNDMF